MENLIYFIDVIAKITETIGVAVIFFGTVISIAKFLFIKNNNDAEKYTNLRVAVGKSILLGLEILIAADIMATIVTKPNLESVAILAIIVLIRTFLSLSLQVELEGKFPWQNKSFKSKNSI